MNRGNFRNKLARALDTSTSSPKPWTTTELNGIISDAHETFTELVRPLERAVFIPLKAEVVWYRLSAFSTDIIMPLRIYDVVNDRKVWAATISWLDQNRDQWESTTGQTKYWTSAGWDWIGFFPHSASDGGLLRMDYAAWPQAALDDGTSLEIDEEDEDALFSLAYSDAEAWNWDEDKALERLQKFYGLTRGPKSRAHSRIRHREDWERRV